MAQPTVEVIYFPKKCPHCKEILFPVKKMYNSWLECRNQECPYTFTEAAQNENRPDDPYPFTCCYNRS
jgi:hypothetical protein